MSDKSQPPKPWWNVAGVWALGIVGTAVITEIVIGWTGPVVEALTPGDSSDTGKLSAPERISDCREEHDVPVKQEVGTPVWKSCAWPPPAGADNDGYGEVSAEQHLTPKRGLAHDDAYVFIFTSSCTDIEVTWGTAGSGILAIVGTYRYKLGQILTLEGGRASVPSDQKKFDFPTDNELFVVTSGHTHVESAECV